MKESKTNYRPFVIKIKKKKREINKTTTHIKKPYQALLKKKSHLWGQTDMEKWDKKGPKWKN